jgi:hypothetical protein
MDKASFAAALEPAAIRCRAFAAEFVIEELPASLRFDCEEALSGPSPERIAACGGRVLSDVRFLQAEMPIVVEALWSNGWVPSWVNLSVHAVDTDHTRIEVTVSRHLVDPALFTPPLWGRTRLSRCEAHGCLLVGCP